MTIMNIMKILDTAAQHPRARLGFSFLPLVGPFHSFSTYSSPQLLPIHALAGPLASISTDKSRLLSTSYPQYFGSPASLLLLYTTNLSHLAKSRGVLSVPR